MPRKLNEFGHFITKIRTDRGGLSQAEAAKKAGLSQSTVSSWETGATPPEFESLAAYFWALGLKWPESREFFAAALKTFKGKLGIKFGEDGIIPGVLMIDLLSIFLGADCVNDKQNQLDTAMECIDKIHKALQDQKQKLESYTTTGSFAGHLPFTPVVKHSK